MILKELFEATFKNTYEKGDKVKTALGNGVITSVTDVSEENKHGIVMVHHDAPSRKKFNLEDRPYKMTFDELNGHI